MNILKIDVLFLLFIFLNINICVNLLLFVIKSICLMKINIQNNSYK